MAVINVFIRTKILVSNKDSNNQYLETHPNLNSNMILQNAFTFRHNKVEVADIVVAIIESQQGP